MSAIDPARRDLAVVATKQARERHNLLLSLLRSRAPEDLQAARLGMLLAVIEPLVIVAETMFAEPTT